MKYYLPNRFNFSTADSTNSVSICQNAGLHEVKRLEKSVRYYVSANSVPTQTEIVSNYQSTRRKKIHGN